MYISHYSLAEKPFQINTDPKFLWLGELHKEALAVLKYGVISQNGILVLTGDAGIGKTTLINALIDGLNSEVVVAKVVNSNIDLMGFLSLIGNSLHISEHFDKIEDFIFHFSNFLESKFVDNIHVLLIVDEAHKLSDEILEQIRLLLNIQIVGKNLISIYLVGQNELNKKLLSPKHRALRQRVTIHHQIEPLSEYETQQYCLHRLKVAGCEIEIFNQEAITEIYRFTRGCPRLINIICDRALIAGYVEEVRKITPAMIQECSQELRLPGENKIIMKYRLTGMFSSVFNYISNLFLQPKIPKIYFQITKQTKHILAHFFNQFAGLVFKLSKGLTEKGNHPVVDGIKITETQEDSFNQNRRRNKKVFFIGYNWERRISDTFSRFTNSGLRNTALAICSVALTLAWSLWYQGIFSIESNLSTLGSSLAESNVAEKSESMEFANKPSKKFESPKLGLKEKFNTNNLDELDKVALKNKKETKITEPSANMTTESQISAQKSNDVVRQDVGRSESTIGSTNWSNAAYSIQVGAFIHKDNAIKMVVILRREGYSANIVNFNDAKGRVWHTVRIGKYASLRVANKHAKDFSSKQKFDSIVRPIGRF